MDRWLRFGLGMAAGTGLLLASLGAPAPAARAQGRPDQVNNPAAAMAFSCGAGGVTLAQGFTPGLGTLVGAELYLRAGGAFPAGGLALELAVQAADGAVLGRALSRLPGPHSAGQIVTARFDFQPPVPLAVGAPHRLEWVTTLPSELTWLGRDDDPYPRGAAYGCSGLIAPGRDYNFATFGPDSPGSPGPSPSPSRPPNVGTPATAVPSATASRTVPPPATPTVAPSPTPVPLCPQIRDRVPAPALAEALANPHRVAGYRQLERPGLPPGPHNRRRVWLSLGTLSSPYHPLFNGLVWRAGCP